MATASPAKPAAQPTAQPAASDRDDYSVASPSRSASERGPASALGEMWLVGVPPCGGHVEKGLKHVEA